ncbi:MAG TPA: DivIVA domain-containing protein [Candidatus Flavonifractor merdavium]|nr:DivIVA domain-containing protein [Candidatus Flavonifractor merdavium]
MLTPQEVSEHAFAKASFGGYNMAMVDEFLDILTVDYTALYKENATLKAKMKVLVEKVEEYRSTEDAMRKALLTAQKMADDLVAEAEQKRNKLLQSAEEDARVRIGQLQQSVRDEQARLVAAQNATAAYVGKLKELYQHEMDYLSGLSRLSAPVEQPDRVSETVKDIEQSVEQLVRRESESAPTAQEEPASQEGGLYAELMELNRGGNQEQPRPEEDDEVEEPTRRIDFDHLQFGKDYEIR